MHQTSQVTYKSLLQLALPIMAANLLQTLYNLADTYFLGKLGTEAVTAPSISFNLIFFLIVFGNGFALAGTTMISQAKGRGDQAAVDFYGAQMFLILTGISVGIMIFGLLTTDFLLKLLQVPAGLTYTYTRSYMRIIFLGMPFMFIAFVLRGALQGIGNSVTPMKIQLVTVLVNVVLDVLLIFGFGPIPAMGVAGAAYATVLSRVIASAIALKLLIKGDKGIKLRASALVYDKDTFRTFIRIGLPSSLGQGISALGFTALQGVVNSFGPAVIAAFGIGGRIIALFNMPGQGISQAVAVTVGQNLGKKDRMAAKQSVYKGLLLIGVFITTGMTLTFFFGNYFVKFFVDDPDVILYGAQLFRIVSVSVIFFSLYTVLNGAFNGGGDTKPVMVLSIIRLWGIRVPFAWLFAVVLGFGPGGIWWGMFFSNFVVACITFLLFRTNRWQQTLQKS